jgi:hypothetical protein
MWFSRDCTAHLARKPVSIKDKRSRLFRNRARKGGQRLLALKQILARL